MKRFFTVLIALFLITGGMMMFWNGGSPNADNPESLKTKNNKGIDLNKTTVEISSHSAKEPVIKDSSSHAEEGKLDCHTRYQKHENWKEISDIFSGIYMTVDEMSGDHYFQNMQLEAVKSYADAGDANAMFHYGNELIWKGGFGIYFNELNRTKVLNQDERQEIVNNHKLDMVALEIGAKYLLDAAVRGKLGGILELNLMHQHIVKRQVNSGKDVESIKRALMISFAYEQLLQEVFINDSVMMDSFLFAYKKQELIETFSTQYPKIDLAPIRDEANNIQERLFDYWREEREQLGKPIYPDEFPDYLEQHMANKRKECQE